MVLLEKLWDDVVAGPHPQRGLGRLRKITVSQPLNIIKAEGNNKYHRAKLMPVTPTTLLTPLSSRKVDNIRRNVWTNLVTKTIGAEIMFDKPLPNSPTVYDLLYSCETKSKHG